MLNVQLGDELLRITPPSEGCLGYSQAGTVSRLTEGTVEILVQADIPRRMEFSRIDGFDTAGLGTFVVRPDTV
jgi:hypothetical protein